MYYVFDFVNKEKNVSLERRATSETNRIMDIAFELRDIVLKNYIEPLKINQNNRTAQPSSTLIQHYAHTSHVIIHNST